MDILAIAEQNFAISLLVVIAIGVLQGAILGRGIRSRFPSLKVHARIVSLILLILFSINAIANILKFAIPDKISFEEISMPTTPEEGFDLAISILGLNAGFGTAIAMFVTITLILVFRFANLPNIARYFFFAISFIMFLLFIIGRFTDFVPTSFQILMYAFYQIGITIGIFVVTRRRDDGIPDFK